MIDQKTLRQLIRLMVENDLTELDLEAEGEKVKLKRSGPNPEVQYVAAPHVASAAQVEPDPASAAVQEAVTIDCPMVGTFYSAPSPDAKPFVEVGDPVDSDTVVCIIEAMKVFNEIKAETAGKIKKFLVETGQAVEFGQPLFVVNPD